MFTVIQLEMRAATSNNRIGNAVLVVSLALLAISLIVPWENDSWDYLPYSKWGYFFLIVCPLAMAICTLLADRKDPHEFGYLPLLSLAFAVVPTVIYVWFGMPVLIPDIQDQSYKYPFVWITLTPTSVHLYPLTWACAFGFFALWLWAGVWCVTFVSAFHDYLHARRFGIPPDVTRRREP